MLMSPVAFALGAATWSFAEYSLHRFVGHGPRASKRGGSRGLLDGDFGSEHQAHHSDTRYFTPTAHKARAAALVVPAIGALGSFLVGPRRGISFALGFGLAYAGYEVEHRRVHTHAPRGPYTRWSRRHHLAHHFTNPHLNHGVTSPLWDHVFGTYLPPGKVRVPRRHVPDWLLDAEGNVKAEYADDYELPPRAAANIAA
ncbi:MAG: sterol desaturase family protein [Polyangiaceae bacterium]